MPGVKCNTVTGRRFPDQSAYYPTREVGAASGQRGSPNRSPSRRGWRGQNLVEFALIVPVLALFVFGVLDVARIFHALIAISNAAREGARYGMAYGVTRSVGNVYSINETIIDNATIQEAANLGVTLAANQVTPTCQINPDPAAETCGTRSPLAS